MNIDRERMEQAVDYLARTDLEYARARALYEGFTEQRKVVKARQFSQSRASSMTGKEQDAYNSMHYQQHLQKIQDAHIEYLTLQAKRATETTIIDCWRSLNAARNKGQII